MAGKALGRSLEVAVVAGRENPRETPEAISSATSSRLSARTSSSIGIATSEASTEYASGDTASAVRADW